MSELSKYFEDTRKETKPPQIFVFGSNLAGVHGAGAALAAEKQHGAVRGKGIGLQGYSYAIPTKDRNIKTMHILDVRDHVEYFLEFARSNPQFEFKVTQIGCGLAGFKVSEIAPLFVDAPSNCLFDTDWIHFLPKGTRYWGSFS